MSRADEIFKQNCRDILDHGVWDTELEVRPHWDDGTPAHTVKKFGIINRYVRFVDKESGKSREEWPLNPVWETFIGKHRNTLKLTTAPEPYTLERTLNWFSHQVAPTAKMLMLIDEKCGTSHVKDILDNTELRDKHRKIIQQKMRTVLEMIQMEDNE